MTSQGHFVSGFREQAGALSSPFHTRERKSGPLPGHFPASSDGAARVRRITVFIQRAFPCPSDTWGGRSPQLTHTE